MAELMRVDLVLDGADKGAVSKSVEREGLAVQRLHENLERGGKDHVAEIVQPGVNPGSPPLKLGIVTCP